MLIRPNARFGSKADMTLFNCDVRFTPNSDRKGEFPQHAVKFLLPDGKRRRPSSAETFTHLSALSHDLIEVIMTTHACRLEVQFVAKGKRSLNLVMLFAAIGKIKEYRRGTCQKQNVCRQIEAKTNFQCPG